MSKNKRRFEEVFESPSVEVKRGTEFFLILSGLLAAFSSRGLDEEKIEQLIKQAEKILEKTQ